MRVAVIHNLRRGGAHRRLSGQLDAFTSDVIELCPATADPITADPIVVSLALSAPDSPRPLRPPLRYLDQWATERAWATIAQRLDAIEPDAVYANPCRFLQAPPALRCALAPSVYFCDEPPRALTDPALAATINPATRPLYAPIYARRRALDRASTRAATELLTNSAHTATTIARVYGRPSTVIPMGVSETLLALAADPAIQPRAAGGPSAPDAPLLTVGALIPTKGHDLAIEAAFRAARRRSVTIVAPRHEPAEENRLRDLAQEHDIPLTIRTGVTDQELAALYAGAYATFYLAHREPFGLASLEAQAFGCPVIVADEGGLPETVLDGVTGWVVPRSASAAADRLNQLDPAARARMSTAAAARARQHTWRASAQAVEARLRAIAEPAAEVPV